MTGLEFIDYSAVEKIRLFADKDIKDLPDLYRLIAENLHCATVNELLAECEGYLRKKYANLKRFQKNIKQ